MKNLFKAIAAFQQECPVILKDTSGYGYKYADLTQIDSVIKPLLSKHGLSYVQPLQDNSIKTILFHIESGEQIESICTIPFESVKYEPVLIETTKNNVTEKKTKFVIAGFEGMNTAQAYGSLITYFRRYTISSMLGLITDKDTDGTGVPQQPEQPKQPEQKKDPIIEKYAKERISLLDQISKCNTPEDLTIIKESYPDFLKISEFKTALVKQFESFSK